MTKSLNFKRSPMLAALFAALTMAGPIAATAQQAADTGNPVLMVTGQGKAMIAPDMAVISLGVSTRAVAAAEAMTQNSQAQTKVIEALKASGLAAEDIQTSGLNLSPMMRYAEGQAPRVEGYTAQNMVTVRVKDLPRLGQTLDAIVGAGANEINGISFQHTDPQLVEDEARAAAVADARHRAEVLAQAAGLSLGQVLSISDTISSNAPQPLEMGGMAMKSSYDVPVEAGQLQIDASVQMRFALTPAQAD